jgi:regulator of protease activity HflC (stomatin/prohibitin superfamily)
VDALAPTSPPSENLPPVARGALFLALVAASAALACASVPAGHGAVVTSALGGLQPEPLHEGVSWVGFGAQVDVLDLRAQERNEDLKGIAADGAPVQANASVVTWHIVPDELVAFDREIGPHPYARIIRPIVQAAVRKVVARYSAFELMDTQNLPAIQKTVTQLAARQIRPMHVQLDMVFMRSLMVASGPCNAMIIDTSRLEQQALTMPHEIEIARARAEERRERGRAAAAANATIAPTLTPQGIADAREKAWTGLLTSPSTSVAVTPEASPLLEVTP